MRRSGYDIHRNVPKWPENLKDKHPSERLVVLILAKVMGWYVDFNEHRYWREKRYYENREDMYAYSQGYRIPWLCGDDADDLPYYERQIAQRGLEEAYIQALREIVGSDSILALMHAKPYQRCRALLSAAGIRIPWSNEDEAACS